MAPIAFDRIRVGKKYFIQNLGEACRFEVEEKIADQNFKIKDLETLERYQLQDFVRYGLGKDFTLYEIS